jgi:hypothetical protein
MFSKKESVLKDKAKVEAVEQFFAIKKEKEFFCPWFCEE